MAELLIDLAQSGSFLGRGKTKIRILGHGRTTHQCLYVQEVICLDEPGSLMLVFFQPSLSGLVLCNASTNSTLNSDKAYSMSHAIHIAWFPGIPGGVFLDQKVRDML